MKPTSAKKAPPPVVHASPVHDRVRLPSGSRADLDEIWEFIRADNLDAADQMIAEILAAIRALVPFPNQGYRRPDLTSRPLRFILVREHPIAYAPDEKPLWVIAVIHGRRSPRIMAAILRGRE